MEQILDRAVSQGSRSLEPRKGSGWVVVIGLVRSWRYPALVRLPLS